MIESMANPQIKRIQKLKKNTRFRRQERCFIAEGMKMVEEALRHGMAETVYVADNAREEYFQNLFHTLNEKKIEWVNASIFREISDTQTPQGVMALVRMPEYNREQILKGEQTALLCLEDIRDPGNLGTMLRTAEGAGMDAVVMSRGCVDLFNPKVVRSTMGALFRIPFYITEDMTTEVEYLRQNGFTAYAACLDAQREFTQYAYQGRTALLVGNEANGICPATAALADEKIIIPMEGELESLNAAISAALLMYEVHRKRTCKNGLDIVK